MTNPSCEINTPVFSVAIFKKQLPECCTPFDLVMALQDQYLEELIDMVQPINGLYRIDFLKKEPQLHILAKGLSLLKLTIPVTLWREGMDSPQVRLVLGPVPKDIPDIALTEALEKLGLFPSSGVDHEYWKDKNSGKSTTIKTGKRIVFIKKDKSDVPDKLFIGEMEVPIWFWGKGKGKGNIFGSVTSRSAPPSLIEKNGANTKTSASSPPQDDDDVIDPTPPLAPVFHKPNPLPIDQVKPRGRSRTRSSSTTKRRLSSQNRMDSPSKAPSLGKNSQPYESPINPQTPLFPEEASGGDKSA